jgi:hypothetical protein
VGRDVGREINAGEGERIFKEDPKRERTLSVFQSQKA